MGFIFGKRQPQPDPPELKEVLESAIKIKDEEPQNRDQLLCRAKIDLVLLAKKPKGIVMKIHLENYKLVNDTFGFAYAEEMLNQILKFFQEVSGVTVYHYIGVEFILVLDQWSLGEAVELSETISQRFFSVWTVNKVDCLCSISGGMVRYPDYGENSKNLMSLLDHAIMQATRAGVNQVLVYDEMMCQKFQRRKKLVYSIQNALDNDDVELRYRPTWNTKEKKFTRAECTYRLFIPEIGIVHAQEFLPVAEDSGQICEINFYAIQRVCEFITSLTRQGKEFESIAVQISPVMFLQERFLETMRRTIQMYQIPYKKLALELSESVLVSSFPNVNDVLQELSIMGVELVLNDFGSGYSGINNVLSIPVDVLKLERMFVWQLENNPRSCHVIKGLIQIAQNLGIKLIAEGVETENQVNLLSEYKCGYEQGFYYSATVEDMELSKLFEDGPKN